MIDINSVVDNLLKECEVEKVECEKGVIEFLEGLNNASLTSFD